MNPQPQAMYRATDNELLMRFVKAKDEKCFETLVSRHSNLVYQVCHTVLLNHADAEDAFQATFVVLVRKAKCLLHVKSLAAWLYKVSHRIAVRANQSKRKRNPSSLDFDPAAEIDQFHNISKKEILSRVFDELAQLPSKYKDVLVECYLQGKSYREVADSSDSTETVIKGRVAQAKKTLRQRLLKRGIALSFVLVMLEQIRSVTVANTLIQSTKAATLASMIGESTTKVPAAIQTLSKFGIQRMSLQLLTKPLSLAMIVLLVTIVPVSWMLNQEVRGQDGGLTLQSKPEQEKTGAVVQAKSADPFADGPADPRAKVSKRRNDDPFGGDTSDPFGNSGNRPANRAAAPVKSAKKTQSRFATGKAAVAKIESALEEPTNFDFIDTPLIDVADQISNDNSIAVHIDKRAIEDAGFDEELPMTGRAKNRTLRSALRFLFNDVDFAFVIKNETLIITTEDAIANEPQDYVVSQSYDVTDLVSKDAESIVTTIQQSVDSNTWFDSAGGYATMNIIELGNKTVLSISHTSEHHYQIQQLLDSLRALNPSK